VGLEEHDMSGPLIKLGRAWQGREAMAG